MPTIKRPKKGSQAFYPRKRAKRIYPAVSTYPETEKPKLLDFAGYKAGMLTVVLIDNVKNSPTFGQEVATPATVIECPPLRVIGIRAYKLTTKGFQVLTEVWTKNLPKDIERKVKVKPNEEKISEIEKNLEKISKIRLIVATQPRYSGVGKKKPEIFEIEVGGKDVKEKFEFAKQMLGKDVKVSEVFKQGEYVDVIAVTKGKGTEGPVKRFGVFIQSRHAKEKRRHVGSLGQEEPGKVRHTVPMAGQLGFQTRTEFNKRILKIGEDGKEITPSSGFTRYGVVKSDYILVEGSVPGPKKRLIRIRAAIRPPKLKFLIPEIKEVIK
ncbi:MAG: 50S ribosomal protein L3 [Candidatus Aenigmatarchaeota archaeon]